MVHTAGRDISKSDFKLSTAVVLIWTLKWVEYQNSADRPSEIRLRTYSRASLISVNVWE